LKVLETTKRKKIKLRAEEKAASSIDEKHRLEKQTFRINSDMIADVKKVLKLLGVPWITAPKGYEAEHLGATLTEKKIIDTFITSDSDTLLFGGLSMVRRVKKNNKKCYEEYILSEVLIDYDLTRDELIHLGVVMGSDFNTKTKGIGVKTILAKGLQVVLTDEQKKAKRYFLQKCPFVEANIVKHLKSSASKNTLIKWLVEEKGFGGARIEKLLKDF
jgi:flap endonuclease-1